MANFNLILCIFTFYAFTILVIFTFLTFYEVDIFGDFMFCSAFVIRPYGNYQHIGWRMMICVVVLPSLSFIVGYQKCMLMSGRIHRVVDIFNSRSPLCFCSCFLFLDSVHSVDGEIHRRRRNCNSRSPLSELRYFGEITQGSFLIVGENTQERLKM